MFSSFLLTTAELTASLALSGDFSRGQKSGKNITFGVDFATYVKDHNTEIPYIIRKCVDEIEKRGITLKVRTPCI